MVFCDGCFSYFSASGFRNHCAQSDNQVCRSLLQDDLSRRIQEQESDVRTKLHWQNILLTHSQIFKDSYVPNEHQEQRDAALEENDVVDGHNLDGDHSADIAQAGMGEDNSELGWEEEGVAAEEDEEEITVPRSELNAPEGNTGNDNDWSSQASRKRFETALRSPIEVVKYPSPTAGKPVHASSESAGYQGYKAQLGTGPTTNVYAPFVSKIDWETAEWAKLRGVGSTAVSDLFSVEGVRGSFASESLLQR